jgi:NAD(P)-dependent dehydrogenase (short-subunit alcohol dehydrogenase family)
MMSKAMALDLGKFNIRVNSLVPGYIHTEMTNSSFNDPKKSAVRSERTMLGRWGETKDLIGAAIFLASDASAYITGTDLIVDGGWTAKGL